MVNECSCGCGGTTKSCKESNMPSNYMFFNNLQTIKRAVDQMLEMDPEMVENLLTNGHDWAGDHIATSKDDITEVADFFMNEMGDRQEDRESHDRSYIATFESFINKK